MLIAMLAQASNAAPMLSDWSSSKPPGKAPGTEPGMSKAAVQFGMMFWLIILVMFGASIWITRDAVKLYGQRGALVGGALFACIFTIVGVMMLVGNKILEINLFTHILFWGGGVAWLGIVIGYTIVSMRDKKLDAEGAANRAAAEGRIAAGLPVGIPAQPYGAIAGPAAGAVPYPAPVPPMPAPAAPASAPLARPGLGKAPGQRPPLPGKPAVAANAAPAGEPKPPRASEVDGNPILPDGEVTIRSLCCMAKMRNQGAKFAKQRRCPGCGVEPFRFKLA